MCCAKLSSAVLRVPTQPPHPLLQELDGFQGAMVLADRGRGTNIAISYWESEAAMHASEEAVSEPRKGR